MKTVKEVVKEGGMPAWEGQERWMLGTYEAGENKERQQEDMHPFEMLYLGGQMIQKP